MKQSSSAFSRQHMALNIILCLTVISAMLPMASSAGKETHTADELITLTVKDEPLGEVLKKISMATGYEISVDTSWQSFRVTASLEAVSLHKGLKQILRNLNNVIIYGSSREIKIIIYDKTAPEGVSSPPSTDTSLDRTPVPQRRYRPPQETQGPSSQVLEKEEDGSENEKESSDETDISGQKSETAPSDIDGEEKTTSKELKIEIDEGANTGSQEQFSEESTEQDTQTESKSHGEN